MSVACHLPIGWVCAACEADADDLKVCARCGAYHCVGCNDSDGLCKVCAAKYQGGRVVPAKAVGTREEKHEDRRMGRDVSERNFEYGF